MKRTLLALGLVVATPVVWAAEPTKPAEQAKPAEEKGASALITNALRGLSALLPKPETATTNEDSNVSTIGIRGAESTATVVKPYWKDDRSNDPAFAAELSAYTAAHKLLEEKRWDEAQRALSRFLTEHPKSDLAPNASFGQAIATAGANHPKEAAEQFRQFASNYPNHPLRTEAEKMSTALVSGH